MKPRREKFIGNTRVARVQFGDPPNCGGARGCAFIRTRNQWRRVSPVSGGTPETTRQRRVRQKRIENVRYT
jgi:hypothetical protein